MNVQELIDMLENCNPEALVVMSSNSEGNSYHLVDNYIGVEDSFDIEEKQIYLKRVFEGYSFKDVRSDLPECITLYPR